MNNTNSVLGESQGMGLVRDNDGGNAPASITISDVVQEEGNPGITNFDFTVSLTAPSGNRPVTVKYFTSNGTAVQDTSTPDYTGLPGPDGTPDTTLTFAPGETQKTIRVEVSGDPDLENTEFFQVFLTNATNAVTLKNHAVGVIVQDDGNPVKYL